MSDISDIQSIIQSFNSLSLEELGAVSLLNRTDTKFAISIKQLPSILKKLKPHYQVLDIKNIRFNTYESLYYDTPQMDAYKKHHNQKSNRFKVRYRRYKESGLVFFEVKKKTNQKQTIKSRIQKTISPSFHLDESDFELIENKSTLNGDKLIPMLWVYYTRITLSNTERNERLTIDINLSFKGQKENAQEVNNHDLVIIEVKQSRYNRLSKGMAILHKEHIHPLRISKYCLGMLSCYEGLRYNRFKEKILHLAKITNNDRYRVLVS